MQKLATLHIYSLSADELPDRDDATAVARTLEPIIAEHGEDLEVWLMEPPPWANNEPARLLVAPGGTPVVRVFGLSSRLLGRAPVEGGVRNVG